MADERYDDVIREPGVQVRDALLSRRDHVMARVKRGKKRRRVAGASTVVATLTVAAFAVTSLGDGTDTSQPRQPDPTPSVWGPDPDPAIDDNFDYSGWCGFPYDPPAQPGVTLATSEASDLDISVHSELREFGVTKGPMVQEPVQRPVTEGMLTYLDVSWRGDRHFTVDAYAVWVNTEGLMMSVPYPHPFDRETGSFSGPALENGGTAVEYRTEESGYTHATVAIESGVSPCRHLLSGELGRGMFSRHGYEFYSQLDGDYRLAVVVQVSDEDGGLLATFVDATEVGGTEATFTELEELWLPNFTRANREDIDQILTDRSTIERAVEANGQGLGTTVGGAGVRVMTTQCERMDYAAVGLSNLRLLPVSFPDADALSVDAVPVSGTTRPELEARWYHDDNDAFTWWFDRFYLDATALFFATDGSLAGSAIAYEHDRIYWSPQTGEGDNVITFRGGDECPEMHGVPQVPGEYHVVIVVSHPGGTFDHGSLGLSMVEHVAELWVNVGTVRVF